MPVALHDNVVRRIKTYHEKLGDEVTAELPGYEKPPRFYGPRGRAYIPDVFVFNRRLAYEVKKYHAYFYAVPKLKAFLDSPKINDVVLVLCTGTPDGVDRADRYLLDQGVDCEVVNYQELPFW